MVVFTSGIVDAVASGCVSVPVGVRGRGWGCQAHCWVLKDQPSGWCFVSSLGRVILVGVGRCLVGLLFEICIVDASIFRTRMSWSRTVLFGPVRGCGVGVWR